MTARNIQTHIQDFRSLLTPGFLIWGMSVNTSRQEEPIDANGGWCLEVGKERVVVLLPGLILSSRRR